MTQVPVAQKFPIAPLKIIALESSNELGQKVNDLIVEARHTQVYGHEHSLSCLGYETASYLTDFECPRFGSGEAKAHINESVRGKDIYILVDIANNSISYKIDGKDTIMSPDDHFQDLKRVIGACTGKAHRINVIMPFMYEGRQNKRTGRESLDCAVSLRELVNMGVDNIITFDAHDPRVQNSIPLQGFDNFFTSLQFMREFLVSEQNIKIDSDNLMIISPDVGGMTRAVYYANVLGVDMGMFYKRRDYSVVVNGKNPIVAHEFLGNPVENKDVLIIDDMIASGESMLEVAKELKHKKARRVFIAATFGLFTEGFEKFDEFYEKGLINRIFTTNLTYIPAELLNKEYYIPVDLSKYIAMIIDTLNHDSSVNDILNPIDKIQELLSEASMKE